MESDTNASPQSKTIAGDFFLHLGMIVSLYVMVGFLVNLLFTIINVAYPVVDAYYYRPSISLPVAALIVLFPILIFLSRLIYRTYEADESKKQLWMRRWLTFLTLFIAGAVIAGDFITVIYFFLDGRDLTASFVLKALSLLVVTGMVFGYFIRDLRDKIVSKERKIWMGAAAIVIAATIIAGFFVIGSPQTQRKIKYDEQRVQHIQNIQSQIINYWQAKGIVPMALSDLEDSLSYASIPVDPETEVSYEYRKTGPIAFELCANFNLSSQEAMGATRAIPATPYPYVEKPYGPSENWDHPAGNYCFKRKIDQDLYPLRKP